MMARVWHGWTSRSDAAAYEAHFRTGVLPRLRGVQGFIGAHLLQREDGEAMEFVAITLFTSLEAISAFAGPDPDLAVISPQARPLLSRCDERAAHYRVVVHSDGVPA